jgi:hypothetical protein
MGMDGSGDGSAKGNKGMGGKGKHRALGVTKTTNSFNAAALKPTVLL